MSDGGKADADRMEKELREAYVLLATFSRSIGSALRGDDPQRQRLANWLERREAEFRLG